MQKEWHLHVHFRHSQPIICHLPPICHHQKTLCLSVFQAVGGSMAANSLKNIFSYSMAPQKVSARE